MDIQYKSNPDKCKNCPLRKQYTKSKNHQKIIIHHIWDEYKEQANENRHTKLWKDNYFLRKETIERTFVFFFCYWELIFLFGFHVSFMVSMDRQYSFKLSILNVMSVIKS